MDTYTTPSHPEFSQPEFSARDRVSRIGIALVVMLVANFLVALLISLLVDRFFPQLWEVNGFSELAGLFCMYPCSLIPTYFVLKSIPTAAPEQRKLSPKTLLLFTAIGFFFMMTGSYIGQAVNGAIDLVTGGTQGSEITDALQDYPLWMSIVSPLVIAPIMEELIFRKWLVDRLSPLGGTATIILSGLFFGLFHGNLDQFFYATLIGALLAYIYLNTGKIWHTMLIHAILNFFGGVLPTIFTSTIPDFYTIMTGNDAAAIEELVMQYPLQYMGYLFTSFLPLLFAVAGLIVFCIYFKRLIRWITPCTIPKSERIKTIVVNFGFIAFAIVSIVEMVIVIVENVLTTTGGV